MVAEVIEGSSIPLSAFAVLDRLLARLPAGDADLYPLVFQGLPEPIGIMAPIRLQPVCLEALPPRCNR